MRVLLLMSSVNDSIRLFLNALVTPMGHSARESAHSAERDQTLAGHQTQTHTLIIWTRTHARMLHTSNQRRALTYPFVCLFFSQRLRHVPVVLETILEGPESLGGSDGAHLCIKANACYSERGLE